MELVVTDRVDCLGLPLWSCVDGGASLGSFGESLRDRRAVVVALGASATGTRTTGPGPSRGASSPTMSSPSLRNQRRRGRALGGLQRQHGRLVRERLLPVLRGAHPHDARGRRRLSRGISTNLARQGLPLRRQVGRRPPHATSSLHRRLLLPRPRPSPRKLDLPEEDHQAPGPKAAEPVCATATLTARTSQTQPPPARATPELTKLLS